MPVIPTGTEGGGKSFSGGGGVTRNYPNIRACLLGCLPPPLSLLPSGFLIFLRTTAEVPDLGRKDGFPRNLTRAWTPPLHTHTPGPQTTCPFLLSQSGAWIPLYLLKQQRDMNKADSLSPPSLGSRMMSSSKNWDESLSPRSVGGCGVRKP